MLRDQVLNASHPRPRERFLTLDEISQGERATQVAGQIQRNPQTGMNWVHRYYNSLGPKSLTFRHLGGHPSPAFLTKSAITTSRSLTESEF